MSWEKLRICFLELEAFTITVWVKGQHQEVWTDQSQEKIEEGLRGRREDVSLGFLIVWF